jgi:hypothetical protein
MRMLNKLTAVIFFSAASILIATMPAWSADTTGAPKDPGRIPTIGVGVVISVDRPENCLRVRRGPSTSYDIIGCAGFGDKLNLTGVFSSDNRWAQLDNNGWVVLSQIKTDLRPPQAVVSTPSSSYVESLPLVIEKTRHRWSEPATYPGTRPWGHSYNIWVGGHKNQKNK